MVFVRRGRREWGFGYDDLVQCHLIVLSVGVRVVGATGVAGGIGKRCLEVEHSMRALIADVGSRGAGRVERRQRRRASHGFLGRPEAEGGELEWERELVVLVTVVNGILTAE